MASRRRWRWCAGSCPTRRSPRANNFAPRIKAACANPVANPIAPPGVMERYGSRTKAQKLGIKQGSTVAVIDPPRDYEAVLGDLPEGVELVENPASVHPVTLWFVRDPEACLAALRRMRAIAAKTKAVGGPAQRSEESAQRKIPARGGQRSRAGRLQDLRDRRAVDRDDFRAPQIMKRLDRRFFERGTVDVARDLLGKFPLPELCQCSTNVVF